MLSLPLITPRDSSTLWPHPSRHSTLDASLPASTDAHNPPHAHHHHHRRPHSHHARDGGRSALAALAADENTITARKQNVRRFGAGWIRPPGVPKTYQAAMDEAAEREEQEVLARREQALADMAAAQEQEELAAQREAGADAEGEGEGEGEEERDLDDEVPDAEVESSASEVGSVSAGSEGSEEGVEGQTEMTFNEDSFIEGSMVQADVEQMLELEEAEMAGVLQDERDLDDDVPEAGSYQHTDTEAEDESEEMDEMSFEGRRSGTGLWRGGSVGMLGGSGTGIMGAGRGMVRSAARTSLFSEDGSSMMGGSSFAEGSSPVAARGTGPGNQFRNRLMRQPPRGG